MVLIVNTIFVGDEGNGAVPWAFTVPAAIILFGVLITYWRSFKPGTVPRSRRRIRRANTIVQIVLIPILVYALSADHSNASFLVSWTGVTLLLILTIVVAVLDVVNNLRIHRATKEDRRARKEASIRKLAEEHTRAKQQAAAAEAEDAGSPSAGDAEKTAG